MSSTSKQFETLQQGLDYRTACPHCKQSLEIAWNTATDGEFRKVDTHLYLKNLSAGCSLKINSVDNVCSWVFGQDLNLSTFFFAVHKICINCEYKCVISCTFESKLMKLTEVKLNGESIKIVYQNEACYVRTACILDKLEYSRYDKSGTFLYHIDFPFMEIDFQNPEKTVKRLDKLKPFL